jgi:hypothetical protein
LIIHKKSIIQNNQRVFNRTPYRPSCGDALREKDFAWEAVEAVEAVGKKVGHKNSDYNIQTVTNLQEMAPRQPPD